jgi:hypothetical protein
MSFAILIDMNLSPDWIDVLAAGALVVVDEAKSRVRILPI